MAFKDSFLFHYDIFSTLICTGLVGTACMLLWTWLTCATSALRERADGKRRDDPQVPNGGGAEVVKHARESSATGPTERMSARTSVLNEMT